VAYVRNTDSVLLEVIIVDYAYGREWENVASGDVLHGLAAHVSVEMEESKIRFSRRAHYCPKPSQSRMAF
jgi:hypothetical protein